MYPSVCVGGGFLLLPPTLGVMWTWGCSLIRDPQLQLCLLDQGGVLRWELSGTGAFLGRCQLPLGHAGKSQMGSYSG